MASFEKEKALGDDGFADVLFPVPILANARVQSNLLRFALENQDLHHTAIVYHFGERAATPYLRLGRKQSRTGEFSA
jgi:hypothetical protein